MPPDGLISLGADVGALVLRGCRSAAEPDVAAHVVGQIGEADLQPCPPIPMVRTTKAIGPFCVGVLT